MKKVNSVEVANKIIATLAKTKAPLKAKNSPDLPQYERLADILDEGVQKHAKQAVYIVQRDSREKLGYELNSCINQLARQETSKRKRILITSQLLVRKERGADQWVKLSSVIGDLKTGKDIRTSVGRQVGGLESMLFKAEAGQVELTNEVKDRIRSLAKLI